ncbi:MAG: aspartate--tRNA(Asn) ligase [Patescibacteria group bacterium]|nr:aspartate--tRNA(Asn) ligase [Patescibacteria group bacterium]
MERNLIIETIEKVGQEVLLKGWVESRRDHGKLIFLDVRDYSGTVQVVVNPKVSTEAHEVASTLSLQDVISLVGTVNARPKGSENPDLPTGTVEVEAKKVELISDAETLPFDFGAKDLEINLDTALDYRPLTLRHAKNRAIFRIEAEIVRAFRDFLAERGFTEVFVPKITAEATEGGANVFRVDYFSRKAFLAQSPQFYKQIMVGVYERVFTIGEVYRAEEHNTTRHLNEYTSLDFEFGFIKDHTDVMALEVDFLKYLFPYLAQAAKTEVGFLGVKLPEVKEIPSFKLREAQKIIEKEFGRKVLHEPDLSPQDERDFSAYVAEKSGSEFVFVTHQPVEHRPLYTMPDESDPGYTKSFDLLFRGVEITTGGQRINDYDQLVESMKKRSIKPENFSFYLQAFKYGMPAEGGLAIGLERLTAKIIGADNIREAALFPRDVTRIDISLAKFKDDGKK